MIIVKEKKSVPHADVTIVEVFCNMEMLTYMKITRETAQIIVPYIVQGIITILIALSAGVKYVLLG